MRMSQESMESFRAYALRWRSIATQVEPPLMESEYVHTFIQTFRGLYYEKLCASVGHSFAEVIQQGEMIEDGVRTGRLIDRYTWAQNHLPESMSEEIEHEGLEEEK